MHSVSIAHVACLIVVQRERENESCQAVNHSMELWHKGNASPKNFISLFAEGWVEMKT